MQQYAKPCYRSLAKNPQFMGLSPFDWCLLVPFLQMGVFLGRPFMGVISMGLGACALHLIKWGRLPGYLLTLMTYFLFNQHASSLGYDMGPLYHSTYQDKTHDAY